MAADEAEPGVTSLPPGSTEAGSIPQAASGLVFCRIEPNANYRDAEFL